MLSVQKDGNSFAFPVGEKVDLNVRVMQAPKKEYRLKSNDQLTLYVRREPEHYSELVINKSGDPGSNIITVDPEDTEWLRAGYYSAIICLDIPDEGIHNKIVWPHECGDIEKPGTALPADNFILQTGVRMYG